MNKRNQELQRGFSLVELAVATAVFSMGLGSLSMMMLSAIHGTMEARHRTAAITQATSMAEMIAMQSDAYDHYVNPPGADMLACNEGHCQAAAMAAGNLISWKNQLSRALPGSAGLVCRDSTPDDGTAGNPLCDGEGALVVKVFWIESRHEHAEDGGQRRVVSRLPW